jgi:fatty-acyl-CoA synthase
MRVMIPAARARRSMIRRASCLAITETFKHKKAPLEQDGFDPARIVDPLYFFDAGRGYIPLDADLHRRIVEGERRL